MTEPANQDCQRSELLLSPIFKDLSGEVLDGLVSRDKTLALKEGDPAEATGSGSLPTRAFW